MIDKKQARLRRARKTRAKIAELKSVRLSVHRSNCHIYAQVISACGSRSWLPPRRWSRKCARLLPNGGDVGAAKAIGQLVAERARKAGNRAGLLRSFRVSISRTDQGACRGRA
jgi:large subunit ribosomal protein L18